MKHNGFSLTNNEWLVMEALWKRPSTLMELVRQQAPALAVLDLGLEPEELRKAVIDILMVNAMIHTAAVSPMTAAEFHDKMEGLGMLMSLPVDFTVRDVEKMMTALEGLAG